MLKTNLTEKVADYVFTLHEGALPPEVVLKCKEIILDEVGVLLRASKSKGASESIIHFVSQFGSKGKCTVIGTNLKIDPINAAFANGTLGHDIIELDDVHGPSRTHTAAVIVPAALAVAENENAKGSSLITAVVAGYDIEGRIGVAFANQHLLRGFHASSVAGCFGSAVAAAKALGLSREGILDALGSAGSQASGLMAYQDEAMHYNKSLQTGIAARNGVTAALLAQMGYLAPRRVLDGRTNILDAFSPGKHRFEDLTEDLGSRFEVMRTGLKRSSCCRLIHAPLEAFLSILDEHHLHADDISQVFVRLSTTAARGVDGHPLVTHNVQKVLATAALDRKKVTLLEPYSSDRQEGGPMLAFSGKIRVVGDPELEKLLSIHPAGPAIVEVETRDGKRFSARVDDPRGEPSNPFSKEEVEEKFMSLSTRVVGKRKSEAILQAVNNLEAMDDVEQLTSLLRL